MWGIIYADLLAQETRSGQWGNSNGAWDIGTASDASAYKSYTLSEIPSSGGPTTFGGYTSTNSNTGVITPASGTTGLDRFYVMETTNRGGTTQWNYAKNMKAGTSYKWGCPTKQQWSIFGSTFSITMSNYGDGDGNYGLKSAYWFSTEFRTGDAYLVSFGAESMTYMSETNSWWIRLCTTF